MGRGVAPTRAIGIGRPPSCGRLGPPGRTSGFGACDPVRVSVEDVLAAEVGGLTCVGWE